MDHPQWCTPGRCTADQPGGVHESEPARVADTRMSLSASTVGGTQPVITIGTVVSPGPGDVYDWFFVPAGDAAAVAGALSRFGALALPEPG